MTAPITFASLEVRAFRNLAAQTIALSPRFNVLAGENGQGKTNVLEAMYLAATARSFRTSKLEECVRHESPGAFVRAFVEDPREGLGRTHLVSLQGGRRTLRIDDKKPASNAAYAIATPIVYFDPGSMVLSQGAAAERRRLLDRVALHLAAREGGGESFVRDLERYRRAHLARRRALERRGDLRTIEAYERVMAQHGAAIVEARTRATAAIGPSTREAFARIVEGELSIEVAYVAKGPTDPVEFATLLSTKRDDDARRGTATVGPHLDDLAISLEGRNARKVASQGQHRAIVLALKDAELEAISRARGVIPLLLLDDVSSELDPRRNAALVRTLLLRGGQVVLTTTRPDLLALTDGRRDFDVRGGVVSLKTAV